MIKQLLAEDRPREKMLRAGAAALSDEELLAIFLRTGVKGKSAIQIGRELLDKYGSLAKLARLDLGQLMKEHGMGLAKATQLAAIFELGSRAAKQSLGGSVIDTPESIYAYFAPQLVHLSVEKVIVVLVNARIEYEAQLEISSGSIDSAMSEVRHILQPVIARNSYGFIMLHNHPSGNPEPSAADLLVTQKILAASTLMHVNFIDHLIIGSGHKEGKAPYFSFLEHGLLTKK